VPDAEILMCRYSDNDCDFFLPWAKKFAALPASIYMEVALLDLLCTPKIRDADGRIKNLDNLIEASKEFKTLLEEHGQDYRAVFNALLSEDQPNPTGSFHLNWFDFQKLSDCLTEAGFTHIRRSYYGGSRYAPMREVPLFDGTHPGMSLYVEASKCQ
jgi:6-phosphogluconate dehydrogenase